MDQCYYMKDVLQYNRCLSLDVYPYLVTIWLISHIINVESNSDRNVVINIYEWARILDHVGMSAGLKLRFITM